MNIIDLFLASNPSVYPVNLLSHLDHSDPCLSIVLSLCCSLEIVLKASGNMNTLGTMMVMCRLVDAV